MSYVLLPLLCCLIAHGATPDQWAPARWQGGPLEVLRRTNDKTLPADPGARETIRRWYEPATLDLLAGTPINCLLVTWSIGADAAVEKQQQQLVGSYAREARRRGIAVLGLVYPGAEPASLVSAALEAGLDGLALEGNYPGAERIERAMRAKNKAAVVFPLVPRERLLENTPWPVLALSDALWPRVKPVQSRAGPTGDPWLDSNPWRVRSLDPWRGGRRVWLGQLPDKPLPEDYPRAVADAAMAGGRWIVALDDELRHRLRRKQPPAVALWRRTAEHLKFYQDHAGWQAFSPRARLGVVEDAAGRNALLSGEILNLLSRRQMPYRLIDRARLSPAGLADLDAVVAVDVDPPAEAERKTLAEFAESGGLLVVAPSWSPGAAATGKPYRLETAGRGRIAVYTKPASDPFAVSLDLLTLMGRNNLGLRLFNVSPILSHLTADAAGKRVLLQLVNYADSPVEAVTARVSGDFQAARLFSPGAAPVELPLDRSGGAVEIRIPQVSICAAVLLE